MLEKKITQQQMKQDAVKTSRRKNKNWTEISGNNKLKRELIIAVTYRKWLQPTISKFGGSKHAWNSWFYFIVIFSMWSPSFLFLQIIQIVSYLHISKRHFPIMCCYVIQMVKTKDIDAKCLFEVAISSWVILNNKLSTPAFD